MYCACFSVGKMCDEVNEAKIRPVSVKAAKTAPIIWIDPRPYVKSLNGIHMLFLEEARARNYLNQLVTVWSLDASKNIAIVFGMESSVARLANVKDAETMKTKRMFLHLSLLRQWSFSDLFVSRYSLFFIVESSIHNQIVNHGQCLRVMQKHRRWTN